LSFSSLFLIKSFVYAEEGIVYFSFSKYGNKYMVGLEQVGDFGKKNLTYEWTLFLENSQLNFTTYKPLLYFEANERLSSGKVKVYSDDLSFNKEYSFVFKERAKPMVSIVRYLEDLNVVLPFGRIENKEKLFPLVFNFSSENLSIAWNVFKKFYYSLLFDTEGLSSGTEIKVVVTNIDKPEEFDSDVVKIEK